jgi:hypothetical protein
MGINSRSLRDIADELAARLDAPPGGRDVSNESRVSKGHGRQSGEWTAGASGAGSEHQTAAVIRAVRMAHMSCR